MLVFKIYLAGFFAGQGFGQTTASDDEFAKRCAAFRPRIDNANFEFAEYLPSGKTADLKYRDATCGGPGASGKVAQDVCRVAMYLKTSVRSGVQFEAWLPKTWNQRFLATGNGGIGGCIGYGDLTYTTQHGFAAVGSNNGHNGSTGNSFYHNPAVVDDFAGNSLHTIAVIGKDVVKQFYSKPHSKSYYFGCSQGGRQGVGAAEKYAKDFDGIVAGSPALDFNNLISWRAHFFPITGPKASPDFIKPEVWTGLIHDEVMRQCDAIDGVRDGIIESPDLCKFDPTPLACKSGATANCLSTKQVDIVRRVLSPLTYDDGTVIYSAMNPGSEMRAIDRLYSGQPFTDSRDWFRYVIYSDPTWDPFKFSLKDAAASRDANPSNVKTFPDNLDTFKSNGGKMITYHGQQDQQITSLNTQRWYEHLMASTRSTPAQLDEYIRFFRISGMGHCAGGPGAWKIGQSSSASPFEPESNVLAAIVDWVEKGNAPESLMGSSAASAVDGPVFQRKHCKYPKRNVYRGAKRPDDAVVRSTNMGDWQCVGVEDGLIGL
ncbi:tannase and feruloyl esterase [Microthyrium microscopicum]|uniref:Carboxylic ester hydrolase n=1 Tax=Microthyrium microscopicum TaxID=703497 RepID=A0A6A6UL62_9PEZI|nr:tannase and feruloyl esterase [Microthyrium microscopicum]